MNIRTVRHTVNTHVYSPNGNLLTITRTVRHTVNKHVYSPNGYLLTITRNNENGESVYGY